VLRIPLDDIQQAALRQRAHFLLLRAREHSVPQIGALLGYDTATVRR